MTQRALRSRVATTAAILAVALGAAIGSPASAGAPKILTRDGTRLVDAHGRTVILHGVNAVWKRAPYYPPNSAAGFTAKDADWLVANGFNTVRLGVIFEGVMPSKGVVDRHYLDGIARTVSLLTQRKIWVLLDFHQDLYSERYSGEGFPDWAVDDNGLPQPINAGFPGNYFLPATSRAFDNFWNDADGYQELYAKAWAAVAQRFNGYDYILGYDLFNEPWPGTQFASCIVPAGCPAFDNLLTTFYDKVIAQIRTVDKRRIIWVEPHVIFNDGVQTRLGLLGGLKDPRLGLSWHQYCTTAGLTHSSGGKAGPDCDVQGNLVGSNVDSALMTLHMTGLLTEFGASDDLPDIARVTTLADKHLSGWEYWHYKEWSDPTTESQTSGGQGLFTKDSDLSSLKQAKADILIRPYPRVVAGIPNKVLFTPSTRRLELDYSAVRGATELYLPKRHYPHGYTVAVSTASARARVISRVGAELLEVITDAAGQVVITVTPR